MNIPRNAAGWLALPELEIPIVQDDTKDGRVYEVKKVGFVAANPDSCVQHDLPITANAQGICPLPTCIVGQQLYRLPLSLGSWAEETVAIAHAHGNPFPCKVEFGLLRDRHYAQIL